MRVDTQSSATYHAYLTRLKELLRAIASRYRHGMNVTPQSVKEARGLADYLEKNYVPLPENVRSMVKSLPRLLTYSQRGENPYQHRNPYAPGPDQTEREWAYKRERAGILAEKHREYEQAQKLGFPVPKPPAGRWKRVSEEPPFPVSAPARSRSRVIPSNTKPLPPVPKPHLLEPFIGPNPNLKPLPKAQLKKGG